jgi:FMN phosphatase YigB (HAD superfamily)
MKKLEQSVLTSDFSRDIIRQSGLFNESWYRKQAEPTCGPLSDPIGHFLNEGTRRILSPSPLFDARRYLDACWHLEPGKDNALLHYLLHGMDEGQSAYGVHARMEHEKNERLFPTEASQLSPAPVPLLKTAISVHAFYPEILPEICRHLKTFSFPFTLLITTDTDEKRASLQHIIDEAGLSERTLIRVTVNRGRNFGALLNGFRHALLGHDLFLHLHTKKSLHAGYEQSLWREQLYRGLMPPAGGTEAIVKRFSEDPELGVLQTSPGDTLPYWAWQWLKNRHLIQETLQKIDLNIRVPSGYFSYPAGGMFWARTSAMAPVLKADWKPEDFPPEEGQTDGTIAHVLERLICTVAEARGFRCDEYAPSQGLIRKGWSEMNLHHYRHATHSGLLETIRKSSTISFDIFDTLLTRRTLTPDAVLRHVESILIQKNPSLHGFFKIRKSAEQQARHELGHIPGDITFDDIYRNFSKSCSWSQEDIQLARKAEHQAELKALLPRRDMVSVLKYAKSIGKRVIVTSDIYMTRNDIDDIFGKNELTELVDEFYLSGERNARKDQGDLWKLIKSSENTNGFLHIGDNEQSDIQGTADHGLQHFHVMNGAERFQIALKPELRPSEEAHARDILLGPIAAELFNSPFTSGQADLRAPIMLDSPQQVGKTIFGPLLAVFMARLITHPGISGLPCLLFAAREGYFLSRLYTALAKTQPMKLPHAVYFHTSRQTAIVAAYGRTGKTGFLTRGSGGFRGTFADFLMSRTGFRVSEKHPSYKMRINLPDDKADVKAMLGGMREELSDHASKQISALHNYLDTLSLPSRSVGFVDVGYAASIQTALQAATDLRLSGFYIATTKEARRASSSDTHAFGLISSPSRSRNDFISRYGLLLEALLTAPHGQTTGYGSQGRPIFAAEGKSQSCFHILDEIFNGVLSYCQELIETFGPDVLQTIASAPHASTEMMDAYLNGRLIIPSEVSSALSVEDHFCGNGEIEMKQENFSKGTASETILKH